jgi:hypothetical protein
MFATGLVFTVLVLLTATALPGLAWLAALVFTLLIFRKALVLAALTYMSY